MKSVLTGLLILTALTGTACAGAGTYSVTADDTQLKEIATQAKLTPQQVLQRVVDGFMKGQQQAKLNKRIGEIQQACRGGDTKSCEAIDNMAKALGK